MKTIIVPTDFSEYADYALEFAMELAPKMNANILLLHCLEMPPIVQTLYMENYGLEELYEEAKKQVNDQFAEIREKYHSISLSTAVFQGRVHEVINDVEKEYDAQLVVMGTKGASGMKEAFIGSNTEKVIRNVATPVISLHQKTTLSDINKIVIPTSGEDDHVGFFTELEKIQSLFNCKSIIVFVNALHAFENQERINKELREYAQKANLQEYEIKILRAITPEDGIAEFVLSENADMVAIATHGRHGLGHMIYGSITENLVNHLDIPVFSYNIKLNKKKAKAYGTKEHSGTH